ncbi:MAG: hypothetical protein FRX49_09405 [Trebouxia sp. A1-2]|nr:MAG: hypothetical protein FRX49_09405 [Trebouxia sp. A1-2]
MKPAEQLAQQLPVELSLQHLAGSSSVHCPARKRMMNKTLLTAEDEKEEESSFGQLMTADVDLHVQALNDSTAAYLCRESCRPASSNSSSFIWVMLEVLTSTAGDWDTGSCTIT